MFIPLNFRKAFIQFFADVVSLIATRKLFSVNGNDFSYVAGGVITVAVVPLVALTKIYYNEQRTKNLLEEHKGIILSTSPILLKHYC